MTKTIDLRIHAGAPSSRLGDERYGEQAKAYLTFQGRHVAPPPQALFVNGQDLMVDETTLFLDETQLAYAALDSQLVTSSLEVPTASAEREISPQPDLTSLASSCRERLSSEINREAERSSGNRDASGQGMNKLQPAPRTPSGLLRDDAYSQSSYLKSPILSRSPKRRRLDARPIHATRPETYAESVYIPLPENGSAGLAYIGDQPVRSIEVPNARSIEGYMQVESNAGDEVTSELPTSYSLSDITSESSRAKARPSTTQQFPAKVRSHFVHAAATSKCVASPTNLISDMGKLTRSQATIQLSNAKVDKGDIDESEHDEYHVRNESEKQQNAAVASEATEHDGNIHSSKRSIPVLELKRAQVQTVPQELASIIANLATTATPPEPDIDQKHFITHVNGSLQFLKESPHVGKKYQPVSVARELRMLERGYWLVDCSSLPMQTQVNFWLYLEKTIRSGNLGWGVWCTRKDNENNDRNESPDSIGPVKVFCWGEIVEHIYLMLYVASKGKVRNIGLQWLDTEGKVIVQMKKSDHS